VRADGSKKTWTEYKKELAAGDEARARAANGRFR
jgi:hypothetical protein